MATNNVEINPEQNQHALQLPDVTEAPDPFKAEKRIHAPNRRHLENNL